MIKLDPHEIILIGLLAIIVLLILRSLEIRSKDKKSQFSFDDLLVGDDGKASKAAIVMFGSFVLTSWVVIFQTLNKSLSDLTFGAYIAAWVVPAVARIVKPAQAPDKT